MKPVTCFVAATVANPGSPMTPISLTVWIAAVDSPEMFHNEEGVVIEAMLAVVADVDFWSWLRGDESGSTTIRNLGLVLAGIIGLPIAIWRSIVATRQATAAQHSLLNERYQKGAEMLGSDLLSVRMGGIYALQRLAEEHPRYYHIQIMRLFCAFTRHPPASGRNSDARDSKEESADATPSLREDVQAVMEVIGGRSQVGLDCEKGIENFRLDLFDANLRGARLDKSNLSGANLRGADLAHATLRGANLSRVDLSRADLHHAKINYAHLSRAKLQHATLIHTNASQTDFSHTELNGADLSHARLPSADLSYAQASAANLSHTMLHDANLSHIRASHANFSRASLISSDLSYARLGHANLSGAHVTAADLSHAELGQTILSGTKIGRAIGETSFADGSSKREEFFPRLTQTQLDEAVADPELPPWIEQGVTDLETGKPLIWCSKGTRRKK